MIWLKWLCKMKYLFVIIFLLLSVTFSYADDINDCNVDFFHYMRNKQSPVYEYGNLNQNNKLKHSAFMYRNVRKISVSKNEKNDIVVIVIRVTNDFMKDKDISELKTEFGLIIFDLMHAKHEQFPCFDKSVDSIKLYIKTQIGNMILRGLYNNGKNNIIWS